MNEFLVFSVGFLVGTVFFATLPADTVHRKQVREYIRVAYDLGAQDVVWNAIKEDL